MQRTLDVVNYWHYNLKNLCQQLSSLFSGNIYVDMLLTLFLNILQMYLAPLLVNKGKTRNMYCI